MAVENKSLYIPASQTDLRSGAIVDFKPAGPRVLPLWLRGFNLLVVVDGDLTRSVMTQDESAQTMLNAGLGTMVDTMSDQARNEQGLKLHTWGKVDLLTRLRLYGQLADRQREAQKQRNRRIPTLVDGSERA